jgi:hypothetical protein
MARPGLRKHPKFLLLRELLRVSEAQVLGHLEILWETAYESGKAEVGTPRQVELAAGWGGKSGRFFQAALDCGGDGEPGFIELIQEKPGRYQIHDLYDHAPDYVKKRMEREQERMRKGKTLSDLRSEAGKVSANKRQQMKITCSEDFNKRQQTATNVQHMSTNGATPAPAPAPKEEDPLKPPRGQRRKPKTEEPEIPEVMRSHGFPEAWAQWLSHRSENGWKIGPTGKRNALSRLEAMGPVRATAAIRHSIGQGWRGIFEEKDRNGRLPPPTDDSTPPSTDYDN